MPLIAVAIIYLAIVQVLNTFVSKLEMKLRKNER
jgi:ABC-type arginine/histidine transport system permease subunit